MRNFIIILLLWCLIPGMVYAENITWTGAGGDNNWLNPVNWSSGEIPGSEDNVTIPAGSTVDLPRKANISYLTNYGTLQSLWDFRIWSSGRIHNFGTINITGYLEMFCNDMIENSGTIYGTSVRLSAGTISNNEGAVIQKTGPEWGCILLQARSDVLNAGTIYGGQSPVDRVCCMCVDIHARNIINYSTGRIHAGIGLESAHGGFVTLITNDGKFINMGSVKGGNGGPDGGKDGKASINGDRIEMTGQVKAGAYDSKGIASPTEDNFSKITIAADTVFLHSDSLKVFGDTIYIFARTIILDSLVVNSIISELDLYIYTPDDGIIDFTGTLDTFSIFSVAGNNRILCDSILEPGIGMDLLFLPAPIINPVDTTIIGGYISSATEVDWAGESSAMKIFMQNLSLSSRVLEYTVSSVLGWISPITGSSSLLEPFAFDSFLVSFAIPEDDTFGVQDTVVAILTIGSDFAETTYSYILSLGSRVELDSLVYVLSEGWNMLSYPFFDTLNVLASFPFALGSAWEYNAAEADYDELDEVTSGVGFWLLSPKDTIIIVEGVAKADTITYNLDPGWHMIGGPADTIPAEALTDLEAVWDDIFGYDPILRRYIIVDFLIPGFSYWVFIEDPIEFSLP